MADKRLLATVSGDIENSTNWLSNLTPTTGDRVIVSADATYDLTTNLDQYAVALSGLVVEEGCTIAFGTNTNPLQYGLQSTAEVTLDGTGSKYIEFAGATTGGQVIMVRNANTLHLASYGSYMLASDLNIESDTGTVYVAWNANKSAKVDVIEKTGEADVYIGAGVTCSTGGNISAIECAAGTMYCHASTSNVYLKGEAEEVHFLGGAAITNHDVHKGTLYFSASGMCSTGDVYPEGKLSFEQNPNEGIAMTSCTIHGSGAYQDPYNVVAVGAVLTYDSKVADVHFGTNRKVTTGAA